MDKEMFVAQIKKRYHAAVIQKVVSLAPENHIAVVLFDEQMILLGLSHGHVVHVKLSAVQVYEQRLCRLLDDVRGVLDLMHVNDSLTTSYPEFNALLDTPNE